MRETCSVKASLKRKKCECDGNILSLSVIQKVRASSKLIQAQCQSLNHLVNDTVQPTLREEVFAGINFREFFFGHFAEINFRELGFTEDSAGINFRELSLRRDFAGLIFEN